MLPCTLLTLDGCLFVLSQIVMRHSHYPPILQTSSWTLAVPFKEQHLHRTPSECIGSNYSPRAQSLKISKLKNRRHTLRQASAKPAGPCIFSSSYQTLIHVTKASLCSFTRACLSHMDQGCNVLFFVCT